MTYRLQPNPEYGFMQVTPTPSPEEVKDYYSREFYSGDYKQLNDSSIEIQAADREFFDLQRAGVCRALAEIIGRPVEGMTLLDVGCGWGGALEFFRAEGMSCSGFDPAPEAVAHAVSSGLEVVEAGVDRMAVFGDRRFDVVTMFNVLEHLADPVAVVAEIRRDVLTSDGVLVIDVPNEFNRFQIAAQAVHGLDEWWVAPPAHLNYFSGSSLSALLQGEGFDIERLTASFPMEMFLLFGDDYVSDAQLGRACHLKRVAFETNLREQGQGELLDEWSRWLAQNDLGRQVTAYAEANMRITTIADACHLFEHNSVRLLADPWIGTPANGFWLQYPPPVVSPEEIGALDWIFISHLHEDHCDFATLGRLDQRAKILIMDRQPNLLLDHLVNHGVDPRRIEVLAPRQRMHLADGLEIECLEPNPHHEYSRLVDSAMVLHTDEGSVYFANDSEPWDGTDQYLSESCDVLHALLPFYGGSGYPACYDNLSTEAKVSEASRIRASYLASIERHLRLVRPRHVTPIASWHCFGGPIAELNPVMSWPQSFHELENFIRELSIEGVALDLFLPGQGIDHDLGTRHGGDFVHFTPADRQAFAESSLIGVRPGYENIPNSPAIKLERIFERAAIAFQSHSRYAFPPDFRFRFDCGEGVEYVLAASTGVPSVTVVPDETPPFLKVRLDRRLFALLMIGGYSWNLQDASGLLRYERVPNVYEPEVYVALNFLKI